MRRPLFLLCSLVLVVIQATAVTHDHAVNQAPTGTTVQACDICTAFQPAAPAAQIASPVRHAALPVQLATVPAQAPLPVLSTRAHRSRAPPSFRSI